MFAIAVVYSWRAWEEGVSMQSCRFLVLQAGCTLRRHHTYAARPVKAATSSSATPAYSTTLHAALADPHPRDPSSCTGLPGGTGTF